MTDTRTDTRMDARIDAVRRFNRFYTREIGVLDDSHLQSDFSLGEVRVLYELVHAAEPTAAIVGKQLGLDAGYLSRMLRTFEQRGLVQRRQSAADARRSILSLTRKGRAAFAKLDARARADMSSLLAKHSAADQRALVDAMRSIENVLGDAAPAPRAIELRAPRPGDMGWVAQRHGELYDQEYGWGMHFEALVLQILAQFAHAHDPARERCWIADLDGERAGSVFLMRESDTVGRLRLLLVEPSARGLGLGYRLVDECLKFAREAGYAKVTLWTNAVLHAARAIYVAKGFRLEREEKHTHFGSEQLGQDWELEL